MSDHSSRSARSRRVLVVEDDDDTAEIVIMTLADAGYEVERAKNGNEALERLEHDPLPSLIVLDLHMPGMDGWQFRSHQRASLRLADIPVIVASADESPDAASIEVDYFLRKPFTHQSLRHTVRNAFAALDREYTRAQRLAHVDRLASLGIMLTSVGHEINNALTYVFSGTDFAREDLALLAGELPEGRLADVLERLGDIRTGVERIASVANSLRLVGQEPGTPTAVEVPPLVAAAVTIVRGDVLRRARLHEDYQLTPPVCADPAALTHVFVNLLLNAAQAIREKAPDGNEINVRTGIATEGMVVIEVQDTGAGIPEDLRARVFDPFFTTKPLGVGTGLGLSVSRAIVEAQGGIISFESEVGRGTTFRVLLPALGGSN
jgi:signal transduction histidine kinase